MMKTLLLISLVLLVSACATRPAFEKPDSSQDSVRSSSKPRGDNEDEATSIDQQALQKSLGLDRNPEKLGFQEKSFNTCEVGYGYSKNKDCQKQHFVVIHFRLQCRDSEGTVTRALSSADLTAIADRDIRWAMTGQQGTSRTDVSGYAQIRGIFSKSPKKERLKLATNGEFLYIRAGEIDRIVTPKSWCPYN